MRFRSLILALSALAFASAAQAAAPYAWQYSSISAMQAAGPAWGTTIQSAVVNGTQGTGDTFDWVSATITTANCTTPSSPIDNGTTFCVHDATGTGWRTDGYTQRVPLISNMSMFGASTASSNNASNLLNLISSSAIIGMNVGGSFPLSQSLVLSSTTQPALSGKTFIGPELANLDFTNGGTTYPTGNLTSYICGICATATNSASPEQTGLNHVNFQGINIFAPSAGVGLWSAQGSYVNFNNMTFASYSGTWAQYLLAISSSISDVVKGSQFGNAHRAAIFLSDDSGDGDANNYNDSIFISDNGFTASAFSEIADTGSGAFGVRVVKGNTQSAAGSYYNFWGGAGEALDYSGNWTEGARQAIGGWPAATSCSGDIPVIGTAISGVDNAVPCSDWYFGGWGYTAEIHNNMHGNPYAGYDVSEFEGPVEIYNTVLNNNLSNLAWFAKDTGCVGSVVVQSPYMTTSPPSSYVEDISDYGTIAKRGYSGQGSWANDVAIGTCNETYGSGSSFAEWLDRDYSVSLSSVTSGYGDYPVLAIPANFAGTVIVDVVMGNASGGHSEIRQETDFSFSQNSSGIMTALGSFSPITDFNGGTYYGIPAGTGMSYGYIDNSASSQPTIYIGLKYPNGTGDRLDVRLRMIGSVVSSPAIGGTVLFPTITDYTTAAAAITAAGSAGHAFTNVTNVGVSKTCTTYPTVVNGLVVSC